MPVDEHIHLEFDQLVARHRRLIEFLCQRGSYGQEVYYRDLMQECYVALFNHLSERVSGWSELRERVWVYWQCRKAVTTFQRRVRQLPGRRLNSILSDDSVAPSEVTQLTIDDLAACLSRAERRLFLLMVDGLSDDDILRELGVNRRTLIQMRHNIKKKLQQYIKQ